VNAGWNYQVANISHNSSFAIRILFVLVSAHHRIGQVLGMISSKEKG
jgi:hypothetical protein